MADGASAGLALGTAAGEAPPGATDLPPWAQAARQIPEPRKIAINMELCWERFFILKIVISSLPLGSGL
jgi:hypothetical protein